MQDFDIKIIDDYIYPVKIWDYRHVRCYRTLEALHPQLKSIPFDGVKHTALDDSKHQARIVWEASQRGYL